MICALRALASLKISHVLVEYVTKSIPAVQNGAIYPYLATSKLANAKLAIADNCAGVNR
jgi:hypothetical protein